MKSKKIVMICQAAMIAALYVVLTYVANMLGLANRDIQVRFSEALTILPFFTPAAIPGLTIGCFLSNILTQCMPLDVLFGTLAMFLGAVGTYAMRRFKWLAPVPPIVANTVIVPWVLRIAYGIPAAIPYLMFTVGVGEVISCGVLGMMLLHGLNKNGKNIFQVNN